METISNEEKAREFATSYDGKIIGFARIAAMQMAQWKDAQHKAEKQQWIMKAKEWLHDNTKDYISYTDNEEIAFNENGLVIDFAKALENEL